MGFASRAALSGGADLPALRRATHLSPGEGQLAVAALVVAAMCVCVHACVRV